MSEPQGVVFGLNILDRMVQAVEAVKDRLRRAATALEQAGVAYAVVGGNAVSAWVASVDKAATRNTPDVDLLVRCSDVDAVTAALTAVGFVRDKRGDIVVFLDGPTAKPRDAVHVLFAREKVRQDDPVPAPDVDEITAGIGRGFRVLSLEPLVRMKLTSHRLKDQVHIQDMIGVGLIDPSWVARFPPVLAARLQALLDNPTG